MFLNLKILINVPPDPGSQLFCVSAHALYPQVLVAVIAMSGWYSDLTM